MRERVGTVLSREFYARPSVAVAPELLNKVMVAGPCRGRIVEVEAYAGPLDPASHAYRGPTRRTATMFGSRRSPLESPRRSGPFMQPP